MKQSNEKVQGHFDQRAGEYNSKYQAPSNIFNLEKIRRMEVLAEYVRTLEPRHILDAGCGSGVPLSVVRRHVPQSDFAGLDLSFSMVQQARANNPDGVRLLQSVVEQLPFRDDSFDLVYALGVLDYLENPTHFLGAVYRVLKPGGHFIFTYPNADCVHRRPRLWLRSLRHKSQNGVAAVAIKPDEIHVMINDSGFDMLSHHFITYGNGVVSFPWSAAVNRKMEEWFHRRVLGKYLAWSAVCILRRVH